MASDLTPSPIISDPHRTEQMSRPITFEDLGIPRSQQMRTTVFGNIRTCQSLRFVEWIMVIGGLLSVMWTIGLAAYRLSILPKAEPNYVFAILLIFHSAFCILYIVDGVFREQAFEVLAFVASCVILMIYVVINYIKEKTPTSDTFELVCLIVIVVFGTFLGIIGIILGKDYWQSQNLIFRTVGADGTNQAMCRTLFTTITLIFFDTQLVGSVLILAIRDGVAEVDLEEILTISIGCPLLLAWTAIAYLAVRLESRYFWGVTLTLSPLHAGYLLYAIIQTALKHRTTIVAQCRYAASAGSLVVHTLLIIFMIRCSRNFGRGLKEKVYPRPFASSTAR